MAKRSSREIKCIRWGNEDRSPAHNPSKHPPADMDSCLDRRSPLASGGRAVCCTAGARRRGRQQLGAAGRCLAGGRPWGVGGVGGIEGAPFGLWEVWIKHSKIVFEAEHRRHAAPPLFKRSGHVCAAAEASSFAGAAAGSSRCGASPA